MRLAMAITAIPERQISIGGRFPRHRTMAPVAGDKLVFPQKGIPGLVVVRLMQRRWGCPGLGSVAAAAVAAQTVLVDVLVAGNAVPEFDVFVKVIAPGICLVAGS